MATPWVIEIIKTDIRPVRAILRFCPYRANILKFVIKPKALPLGWVIFGFQLKNNK